MLTLRTFPRCIHHYLKQSQLHTSVKLLTAKDTPPSSSLSSLSSSDSSDSDSDNDKKIHKEQTENVKKNENEFLSSEKTNDRLNTLLMKIAQASAKKETLKTKKTAAGKTADTLNVALLSRKVRLKKVEGQETKKEKPIEEQIIGAAKVVAETLGGDTQKTELELLNQVLNLEPSKSNESKTSKSEEEAPEKPSSLGNLLSSMKVDKPIISHEEKRNEMAKKVKQRFVPRESSIARSLLHQKSLKYQQRTEAPSGAELNAPCVELNIFKNMPEEPQNLLQMSTWKELEKREMKLSTMITPQNAFQELILWTEEGKLWHFPINNEQGMEEEEKVHFSEHVFMDRHLKDWCPKKGPVRHFMDLVCIGLSKNPYMTVEEKVGHIAWYKSYFESKMDLLRELGALGEKAPVAPKESKQLSA